MADSPAANSGEFMRWFPESNLFTEPRNNGLISTTDAAAFTFDLSELAQLDNNPEAFSQWCQFPGDQMEFSSQATTKHRTDQLQILDQQPHGKNVSDRHIRQHEPIVILPSSGARPAESLLPNQYALLVDETRNGSSYVLDDAQATRTASLLEGSGSDVSWTPPPIESGTLKHQNPEKAVELKKRHLDVEDGEPYPPRLVHYKRQKTAAYDFPNKDQVGTIEATFFEDWLSKFPDVYPGPEQFVFLAGLTQLRTETVQTWFNKRLRNGPRSIAFANLPMKPAAATKAPNPGIPQMNLIEQPSDQPVQQPPDRTLEKAKLEASDWVREHKVKKCRKRRNPKNFVRDPERPYCCTLGCETNFKDRDDWRKHEERNYPQGGWICDVGSVVQLDGRTLCAFCGILNPKTEHDHGKALCSEKKVKARGRLHFRKQHFSQHFIRVHPGIPCDRYLENNYFIVKSKFPRRCGFCRYLFKHWRDRIGHVGGHFIAGKDMSQWDFGVEDDEVDQAKDADHENPDGDGGLNGKRHEAPDDDLDSSDDVSNDSPPKSAPKQRRRNMQHTYARQTCSLIQSRDINSVGDFGRTTHIPHESHSVPLIDSFPNLEFPTLEPENISYTSPSITAPIVLSATNNKLTRPFVTKAVLKRTRPLLSDKCRLFTDTLEVKAIERSRYHRVPHFLRTCENLAYFHLRTNLSTSNDLTGLIQSCDDTLIPSVEAIARWCKLLTSGTVNSETQTAISVTRHAPEISENLSSRLSADTSSLAGLLLDMWRLLVEDEKATFKSLVKELFSSSALCHENFAHFQEWISLLRKNGHVMRTRVARKALHTFDTMLTLKPKDTLIAFDLPSDLHSGIHQQPIEKPLVPVVENQHNASLISVDTISEVSMALCADVQSASGWQDTSKAPRHFASMSQDDFSMSNIKSITRDAGNTAIASTQIAVPDETFRGEIIGCSPSSRSNDLSRVCAAEARAPSTGVQSGFHGNGIGSSLDLSWSMLCNSFLETDFDYNNSSTAKPSCPAGVVDYALQNEPFAGLPWTETWRQSTAPWDVTFATSISEPYSTSPVFPNLDGHDLSSASGIQWQWLPIAEALGSIKPPILSPDLSPHLTPSAMEHPYTLVSSKGYRSSKSWDYSSHSQTKGRRVGPLSIEMKKKAALTRKVGACWRCRVSKARCDIGAICNPCANVTQSPLKGGLCVRTRIRDYVNFLLPDTITSRYSETAIQVAIRRQIGGFTNNRIEILMSTRSTYPPIPITVHEFIPLSHQPLRYAWLLKFGDMPVQNTHFYAPPLALLHYDPAELKAKLSRHVKAVIEVPLDRDEIISGETWIVSYKTFEAVNRYRRASDIREKDRILELAFELHTMHYIMSRLIIIERSSASQAFAKLQRPHVLPYNERILSSDIINLQLKCEMITLLRETTAQVLRGLEHILEGTRGKHTTWSIAFCLMIVVCSCIEAVEIATDATIVMKMLKAEITTADISRAKHCQELEQVVFDHVKALFMYVYKSHRKSGFNPIRDGLELNEEKGITLPMVELVQDLRRIIEEHEDDINDRAKDPNFKMEPANLLEDHCRIREHLLGRLLSKFLKEFGWQKPQSTRREAEVAMNASD